MQAMVLEAEALERILRHLGLPAGQPNGLPTERPHIAPARAPPQQMLPGWE